MNAVSLGDPAMSTGGFDFPHVLGSGVGEPRQDRLKQLNNVQLLNQYI